jgi:flagellin
MNLNSVNTNLAAMTALQSLNRTNDALGVVQKRVSTGYRVADAKDDGGAFAVAQSVRGDIAGLTAANEQLGGLKGIVDVTLQGLGQVSKTMVELRTVLTPIMAARYFLPWQPMAAEILYPFAMKSVPP